MKMPRPSAVVIGALCLIAIILSSSIFFDRVKNEYIKPYPYDLWIFSLAIQEFQHSGTLYRRSDNLTETYRPGAPLFKFPPAYLLAINPWIAQEQLGEFFDNSRYVTLSIFLISLLWLTIIITKTIKPQNRWLWFFLIFMHASLSSGFIHSFELQTAEIPFLLLLTASLAALQRYPALSGAAIAAAATAKLYPCFMLLSCALSTGKRRWLAGFFMASIGTVAAGIMIFGFTENHFYLTEILPILLNESLVFHPFNISPGIFIGTHFLDSDLEKTRIASNLLKLIATAASIGMAVRFRHTKSARTVMLGYAFFVAGMFMMLPNCWIQYWVLMLIPIFVLSAFFIREKQYVPLAMTTCIALAMNLEPSLVLPAASLGADWSLDLGTIPQQIEQRGLNAVLFQYSKPGWFVYWATELRMLAPPMLWLALGVILWRQPREDIRQPLAPAASA